MAITLNMVTVGNDFVLRVKVGMVQYSNNSVQWDYMDLTTCRNIVFNISCTKHDIDINLPYTIDQTDHAVISATVRAEMLHENSIYNFSITGIDSEGYRWTYISPKQQSFVTTSVSQDSANAYTELAFTAGMIMPLAAQGKNGYTPYIGQNNHWWINGEDTGVSAVGDIDLSSYATKEYVDDAIENIDIPETDLTNYYTKSETDDAISDAIENIDLPDTDLTNYYTKSQTDDAISDAIDNIDLPDIDTSDLVRKEDISYGNYVDGNYADLDTGVPLSDTLRFVIDYQKYGLATYYLDERRLISAMSEDLSTWYFAFGTQWNDGIRVYYVDIFDYTNSNTGIDFNRHTIEWSLRGGLYFDNEYQAEGTQSSIVDRITNDGKPIPNIYLHRDVTNHIALYNVKIYDGDTLLRDYEPVTTENGNGYYDKVNDTYLLSNNLTYYDYYIYTKDIANAVGEAKSYTDNKMYNELWNPVNEIYACCDCTEAIDKILNRDTIGAGWDIQNLWECAFNRSLRKAMPEYKTSPVSYSVNRDENNQTMKTYYRFWNRDDGLYYNVTVQWYYYREDVHEMLDYSVVSTSYSTTEYATKGYVDNAIQNIPGGSTPDLSNYVTTSYLNSNYYDKQTSDNKVLESPINNTSAQYIPHSTVKFLGTTDRIKIYDIFKLELNGMAIRSSNGFKIGILSNETDFTYANLSNLTYDNHVNINIWWKEVQTRAITHTYEYFDTTFELTTADNNISFNIAEEGNDMLGHYIIVDIEGAYFGAVEAVSDISTYTGSEDTTDISINQHGGINGYYDPATTKFTVFGKYYQNNANATLLTTTPIFKLYATKEYVDSVIPSIQTMTQAQYDELVADNEISSNTLYIIL